MQQYLSTEEIFLELETPNRVCNFKLMYKVHCLVGSDMLTSSLVDLLLACIQLKLRCHF